MPSEDGRNGRYGQYGRGRPQGSPLQASGTPEGAERTRSCASAPIAFVTVVPLPLREREKNAVTREASKPDSVHHGCGSGHSSVRSTRNSPRPRGGGLDAGRVANPLFDLAPEGCFPCGAACAIARGSLTPPFHPYPACGRGAVCFLWHFPLAPMSRRPSSFNSWTSRPMESGLSSPAEAGTTGHLLSLPQNHMDMYRMRPHIWQTTISWFRRAICETEGGCWRLHPLHTPSGCRGTTTGQRLTLKRS